METYEIAATVILVSVGIGLAASIIFSASEAQNYPTPETSSDQVHRHALFHVVINGSEKDFTDRKFQLNSRAVHLENNKSDIVHTHRAGVTWKDFLQTINTTYWRSNSTGNLCISIFEMERCGEGKVVLNGKEIENFGQLEMEIGQGDNFLIVMDTENQSATVEEYMETPLPRAYKPQSVRGQRI